MAKNKIKRLIAVGTVFFSLVSFLPNVSISVYSAEKTETQSEEPSMLTYEEEQGAILHAWDWSFKTIENNLDAISNAGYTAIQVSPIQGNKDGSITDTKRWWILYQPINFKIGNKQLGDREEFKNLCDKAKEKGIKIYVDVIANHTGNDNDDATKYPDNIDDDIKNIGEDAWHNPLHSVASWDDRFEVTHGCVGLPDLNTENKRIQNLFKKYLQDCLDCGADGFRVDTAKHIGLPTEEGNCRSDFWPNAFGGLRTQDNKKPYVYGEVLQGGADNYKEYSNYINLTSSNYGNNVRKAVGLGSDPDVSKIENYDADGVDPSKLITWVESHDTYANDSEESTSLTDEQIKYGWALIASRADANPLFFNRPAGRGKLDGNIGDTGDDLWRDADVVAVNKFRIAMKGKDEKLVELDKKTMIIQRGSGEDAGFVIVNMDKDKQISSIDVNLEDGSYSNCGEKDASFTVKDGKINGIIPNGITVLYKNGQKEEAVSIPKVSISPDNKSFSGKSLELTLKSENAEKATYSINGGIKTAYKDEDKVVIGKDSSVGDLITVNIEATNEQNNRTAKETYKYIKKDENSCATVYFKRDSNFKTAYIYAYNELGEENTAWPGEKMTYIGNNIYKYDLKDFTDCNVIINDWFYGNNKTGELSLGANDKKIYSESDSTWTNVNGTINEDTDAVEDGIKDGTSKVYFKKPDEWKDYDDVYVYFYGNGGPSWPGVPMKAVEGKEGLYTYTLPEGLEGSIVLFNAKGGTVQVPENTGFKAPADSTMIWDGEWKEYLNGTSKAYFRKPADWGEPNIYVWKDDNSKIEDWPGIPMNKVEGTETLYSYILPENYGDVNIIFNDGTNKTDDLKLPSEKAMIYDNGEFRDFITDDLEEPVVESDEEGITRVYFKNTFGWDKVKVYAYNEGTSEKVKDWPGVSAKDEGDDLYSYSLPEGFENAIVIFNNGSGGEGNQTGNLETRLGSTMIYDEDTDSLKSMSKVYFKNTRGWDKVKVHYWIEGGKGTDWPGESPVYYGNNLYGYTLPEGYENVNIIFNNNNKGEQTKTVSIKDGETKIFVPNDEGEDKNLDGAWREFEKSDIPTGSDVNKPDDDKGNDGDKNDDADKLTKAYFENSNGWDDLRIYFYTEKSDGSLNKEFLKWPGVELVSEGNNLYSYTLPDGFKNSTLIFNGKTTTSSAVTADGTEKIDVQTDNLKIKAGEIMIFSNDSWHEYSISDDKGQEVSKVNKAAISGKSKTGYILTAKALDTDGNEINSGITYQWYRSSSKDGEYEEIEGADEKQYKLTSSDKNKYIKVVIRDSSNNEVSSEPTSKITTSSSSSSHHSSSRSKTSDNSADDNSSDNNVINNYKTDNSNKNEEKTIENGWKLNLDGSWSFIENGSPVKGWKQVSGLWYLMNEDGKMQTGWKQVNGAWYLMNKNGAMMTGWQFWSEKWYYLNTDGSMETGWKLINDKWYYLNESGDMAIGWKNVNSTWYYLYSDGSMAYSTSIDGYNLDADGAWK
ncbi:starch-binding protein [uncultured Clostridium sp.]|uniref:starch-binding protein n=1 Tax=uncultured Clostridium sp. TaxID=59620 RepID=UPI0025FCE9DA|nr:starch-binding protein [uncultured Clostridium sp.]